MNKIRIATGLVTTMVLVAKADVERLAFDGWLTAEDQKLSVERKP